MTKYTFESHYVGPYGAHLNCRTKFTRTHEIKSDGTMHPGRTQFGRGYNPTISRVYYTTDNGRQIHNRIAASPKRTTGPRAKASANLDRRRRETEASIASVKAQSNLVYYDGMFRIPGSMKL